PGMPWPPATAARSMGTIIDRSGMRKEQRMPAATSELLEYGLSKDQLDHYRIEGYIILRQVFTEKEMAELSAEANRLLLRTDLMTSNNLRVRFKPHIETGEALFEVFDPFLDLAPVASRLVADRRVLDPLANIYGEEACLFKDKLIFKAPGS